MPFSETLKRFMLERNMRAADLSRATNISEAAISQYLKGTKQPRGLQSIEIAKALNVSLDELWETKFSASARPQNVDLSAESIEVAYAYDKATFKDKNIARQALDLPPLEPPAKEASLSDDRKFAV